MIPVRWYEYTENIEESKEVVINYVLMISIGEEDKRIEIKSSSTFTSKYARINLLGRLASIAQKPIPQNVLLKATEDDQLFMAEIKRLYLEIYNAS